MTATAATAPAPGPRDLLVPVEEVDAYLARRHWSWAGLERGDYGVSLDDVQAHLVLTDPVLWVEANFIERDAEGPTFWRFWNYQRPSLRYRGNVIHEDGAEVGKTREIVALLWWFLTTRKGDVLVAGAIDGNLEDIYDAADYQKSQNPWLRDQVNDDKTKLKPYRKIVMRNGNKADFRPAGHDGRAFRGVHAKLTLFDEASVPTEQVVFNELFRGCLPGCEIRLYSVPTGNRSTPFYRLCQASTRADLYNPHPPRSTGKRVFLRFRWPKTLMPEPFWSEERRQEFIDFYGGEDSPGYQHNVLGNWGDPEMSVFPWAVFRRALAYIPAYLCLKLLRNEAEGVLSLEAYRLNPLYQVTGASGDGDEEGSAAPPTVQVCREEIAIRDLEPPGDGSETPDRVHSYRRLLRRFFGEIDGGHLAAGVDFGGTDAPTEILLHQHRGTHLVCVGRVQLKRWEYPAQRDLIRALDEVVGVPRGWGLDATGVGVTVEQLLREILEFQDRVSGYVFNSTVPELDADGQELLDDRGRPRTVTLKELGTRLLELAIQESKVLYPWDPDLMRDFPGHTYRLGASGRRIYSDRDDHLVDAARAALLRHREMDQGLLAHANVVFHRTGRLRDSARLMEAF